MKVKMKMKGRACELCNQQASLYCPSDSAFLCCNCDATVHQANFLVARHLRNLLCSKCNRFTGNRISGTTPPNVTSSCRSCSPENPSDDADSLPSSSSESCATAPKKTKVKRTTAKRMRTRSCSSSVTDDASSAVAEEVFVKWSRELGLGLGLGLNGNCVASLASQALGFCLGKWRALPFRVAAATSFWLGLRFCGDRSLATLQNLTRLEAISGVPAKFILAAHAKLARVFTHRRECHLQLQERWDES